jgi:hypothetical protein
VLSLSVNAFDMGPVIEAFGAGIAHAQRQLDYVGLRLARAMAGLDPAAFSASAEPSGSADSMTFEPVRFPSGRGYSLLELGLAPSFYRFTEAVIEIKVAMSVSLEETQSGPVGAPEVRLKLTRHAMKISAVNGEYSSRYQYSGESSSRIRSKIVSLPVPAALEARISNMLTQRRPTGEAA